MKQSWRVFWFGVAFVLFAVVTYLAFFHAPLRSVPGPSFFSLAWWLERIEIKPEGRISHVEAGVDFTCISALPGGQQIWVGGSKGVIIYSNDGGRTWKQLPTVIAEAELPVRSNKEAPPAEEQQQQEQQKKQLPPPAKSKSKAFYIRPSASTRFIVESSEKNEWIRVARPETTPPPNAANQAAPDLELPNATKNLQIEKGPANSANQAAPAVTPSKTERGVTGVPAIQLQASPTPQLKTSLRSNEITDLCYVTSLVGYALSSYGELIHTRDGGQTWLGPISVDGDTSGVKFLDENRGVTFGSFGVLRTLDGGVSWSRQVEKYFPVSNIALTNGFNGQAVGEFPGVVEVIDGTRFGRRFEIAGAKNPQLIGITNTQSGSLFACGKDGFVARGTNSGDWHALNAGTTAELAAIFFASDRVGWAIGKQATVITTRDGGEHWARQITPGEKDLKDIYFSSESHGFAAGNSGTVIGTDDGGQRWYPVVAAGSKSVGGYAWLPAPWYFVSLIVLFGLVRRIPDEIPPVTRQGIAELLASDKPIGPGDADYLGFQQTALGLSNYLRNNATKPPLTVAITGEWGMGKSSLMNLVQGDLRSYKFRPVWFNAWHHQTEESLLAALLENVRNQAIPSIFTPEGIVFRVKLLWLRARRNLLAFLLVVAAVSFCVSYFAADPHRLAESPEAFTKVLASASDAIKKLSGRQEEMGKEDKPHKEAENQQGQKGEAGNAANTLLALASAVAALITFLKAFRAFGVDPSSLLASKSNAAKAKDLRAQTSFRYRFENQFHEVTNSLNPLTMVVLVDDLDRCRPAEVYNMLEAINFLVSCGDCFVIMGLARRRVERCVGLVFDKIAAEGPAEIDGHRLSRSEQRQRFAQMYLEKLVNIEVPVPKGGIDQMRTLLISKREEPPPRSKVEIIGEKLSELVPHLVPASLAIAAAVIAVWCGLYLFPTQDNSGTGSGASQASTPQVQSGNEPQSGRTPAEPSPGPTASSARIPSAKFFPGQKERSPLWAILLLTAVILTPGIIRLSRRTGSVIEDSPEFTEALDKWFPFLVSGRDVTPRAIKRFVNRVRYFAMMEGSFRPVRRWWERLAQFLERRKHQPKERTIVTRTGGTREDLLVALATVHERHPEWFTGDLESFSQAVRSVPSEVITRDVTSIDLDTYDHFKKLVAGVEVR